jgi:hypothetical protein
MGQYMNKDNNKFVFDKEKTPVERRILTNNFEKNHQDKIPIILQPSNKNILKLTEKYYKFLINKDHDVKYLINKFKEDNNIYRDENIYFYINGKLMDSSEKFEILHYLYKDEDGFLKIIFVEESADQINIRDSSIIPVILRFEGLGAKNQAEILLKIKKYSYKKYYIHKDWTIGKLIEKLKLEPKFLQNQTKATMHIKIGGVIMMWTESFDELYSIYKSPDGFLRLSLYKK